MASIKAIKGTQDVLPSESHKIQYIEKKAIKLNKGLYKYPENISLYLDTCYYSLENSKPKVATEILEYCKLSKNNYGYYFNEIFYDCIAVIYRIDLVDSTIQRIEMIE